jgi:hypothetical protein
LPGNARICWGWGTWGTLKGGVRGVGKITPECVVELAPFIAVWLLSIGQLDRVRDDTETLQQPRDSTVLNSLGWSAITRAFSRGARRYRRADSWHRRCSARLSCVLLNVAIYRRISIARALSPPRSPAFLELRSVVRLGGRESPAWRLNLPRGKQPLLETPEPHFGNAHAVHDLCPRLARGDKIDQESPARHSSEPKFLALLS